MTVTNVTLSRPSAKQLLTKFVKVLRTDTTAAQRAALPRDAMIVGMNVIGYVASDAATTAVIGVGSTTAANEYLSGYDVKAAGTGEGYSAAGAAAVGNAFGVRLTADVPLYVKYAETGTASTTGGPWYVKIDYFVPGQGDLVDD
jgi:hypothetical protein